MSILNLLNQINEKEIVLPAIQRDFVWDENKITMLLDSIMRGYPVGIVLLWETYNDIQYREFIKDFRSGNRYTFNDNTGNKKLRLVLDGQQRLSSLYIALYGTHEGRNLFFNVLSGESNGDFSETQFEFYFGTDKEANNWNKNAVSTYKKKDSIENYKKEYYVKIKDLFTMSGKAKQQLKQNISQEMNLINDDDLRLSENLIILDDVLIKDTNILKATIIDENKPKESPERKNESDVLEIFVRINTEGVNLNRSDLIFSMLKLNWKESAETLPEFIDKINKNNSFEIDTDFVIRCLFVVSELGSKFDIKLLRKKENIEAIKHNFNKCCSAIESTIDFIQNDCWCSSNKVIGSNFNLIPIVYYLFHTKNHLIPNSEIVNVRKSFLLLSFTSPFSRYADSRIWAYIKRVLSPYLEAKDYSYPFNETISWIHYWTGVDSFNSICLSSNIHLTLHLLQQIKNAKVQYKNNSPEIDHIFPRSILREKGHNESDINNYANFWVLGKTKNQNKTNKDPKKYFSDVPDSELKKALIDRNLLTYSNYKKFIDIRGKQIIEFLSKKTEITDADFEILNVSE